MGAFSHILSSIVRFLSLWASTAKSNLISYTWLNAVWLHFQLPIQEHFIREKSGFKPNCGSCLCHMCPLVAFLVCYCLHQVDTNTMPEYDPQIILFRTSCCQKKDGVHKSSIEMQDVLRKKKKKSTTNT